MVRAGLRGNRFAEISLVLILAVGAGVQAIGGFQYENYPWSSPAFSPDGRTLALVGGERVFLYDCNELESGLTQRMLLKGHTDLIVDIAFSPDGQRLASGGSDQAAVVWDLNTGNQIARYRSWGPVLAVRFSPDGTMFATGSSNGTVVLYDGSGKTLKARLPKVEGDVFDLAFHPDSTRLAVAARRRGLRVWDFNESRWIGPTQVEDKDVDLRSVAYSPKGDTIAGADFNGTVSVWDSSTFELRMTRKHEHGNKVWFHQDGELLATVGANRVKLWRLADGEELHDAYARFVCFMPDRKRLLLVRYGGYSWLELDQYLKRNGTLRKTHCNN